MKFTALLQQFGNNTGIEVPPSVLDELGGGKRPKVRVTLKGYAFQLTLGSMRGKVMIPVSAERRKAAGVEGGDTLLVEIEIDNSVRVIDVPEDLASALKGSGLQETFDKLAPSHRKEHVRAIGEAKAEATRQRRIAKAIQMLQEKAREPAK